MFLGIFSVSMVTLQDDLFVRYRAPFIVIKRLGFAWRRGKLICSRRNQPVSRIRVFAWRHWRTPLHYRRVPPSKGCTPIRLRQLLKTHFLELSKWFSTHIHHMRDLKLSSLRPRTMSIDRYKLGCLHEQSQTLKACVYPSPLYVFVCCCAPRERERERERERGFLCGIRERELQHWCEKKDQRRISVKLQLISEWALTYISLIFSPPLHKIYGDVKIVSLRMPTWCHVFAIFVHL